MHCGRRGHLCSRLHLLLGASSVVLVASVLSRPWPLSVGAPTQPPEHSAVLGVPALPLEVRPDSLSLGVLESGQSARRTVTIHNPTSHKIDVERVETSCSYVSVFQLPIAIQPCDTAELTVVFDPKDEPEFVGQLSIGLTGIGNADLPVFRERVDVDVRSPILKNVE